MTLQGRESEGGAPHDGISGVKLLPVFSCCPDPLPGDRAPWSFRLTGGEWKGKGGGGGECLSRAKGCLG